MWCVGGILVMLLTGWELGNVKDLFKIAFWPISIFICK